MSTVLNLPTGARVNLDVFDELMQTYPAGGPGDSSSSPVGICLYGLVRLVQPSLVVEIGTMEGATSAWLARAVAENGRGTYRGYEWQASYAATTAHLLERAVPGGNYEVINANFIDSPPVECDFAFIDTPKHLYGLVFQNLLLPMGSYVCAHDTAHWDEARMFAGMIGLLRDWETINIQQERGLMIARKVA